MIERADETTVELALPLLLVQMQEHHIDVHAMRGGAGAFYLAVRELVNPKKKRGGIILAKDASRGSVIGVAVLAYTWTIENAGLTAWLDELYVVPELRGHGLGTLLLHHATLAAKSDGCRAMELEVDEDHARVEALYVRERAPAEPGARIYSREASDN